MYVNNIILAYYVLLLTTNTCKRLLSSRSSMTTIASSSSTTTSCDVIPLVQIPTTQNGNQPCRITSKSLVNALQTSGFLLIQSPLLSSEMQESAIQSTSSFLSSCDNVNIEKNVIHHPLDPKKYAMLDRSSLDNLYIDINNNNNNNNNNENDTITTLKQYMQIMELIKIDVLRHLAVGLDMTSTDFFVNLHSEHNDTLRLLQYFPITKSNYGNRCKEHSDYGTITLLSTDSTSCGLEAFHQNQWIPVPYRKGTLVVNIGTLLSGWTNNVLKATLHRVVGPGSLHSQWSQDELWDSARHVRTSIAFFADPNKDISQVLVLSKNKLQEDDVQNTQNDQTTSTTTSSSTVAKAEGGLFEALQGMTVAEYIEWRSGGTTSDRSGIGFTKEEQSRIDQQLNK